jgi:hypothetical protein
MATAIIEPKRPPRLTAAQVELELQEQDRVEAHSRLAGELATVEAKHAAALPALEAAATAAEAKHREAAAAALVAERQWQRARQNWRDSAVRFDQRQGELVSQLTATCSPNLETKIAELRGEVKKIRQATIQTTTRMNDLKANPFAKREKVEGSNLPAIKRRLAAVQATVAALEALRFQPDPKPGDVEEILAQIPPAESMQEVEFPTAR